MTLTAAGDQYDSAGDIAIQSAGFAVAACVCVIVGVACAMTAHDVPDAGTAFEIEDTVNPNVASLASLARLPGIGPVRARALVSHRVRLVQQTAGQPAYRRPEDLRAVPGIGPATVQMIYPWLSFDN
ncbi:MAG: hypothetical protein A2Y77_00405 [Planctomycetes bacterium RBG_13_62_9]|nr:MAG: hypothetical protein A2Y77_00405 [Planctomycetes bacterium RBG_13_62_9]